MSRQSRQSAPLYCQILHLAAGVVQQWRTDVTVIDKAVLEAFQPGDTAVWGPRACGSHLVWMDRTSMRDASRESIFYRLESDLSEFNAAAKVLPPVRWYLIQSTIVDPVGHGHVALITPDRIRDLYRIRVKAFHREFFPHQGRAA